MEMADRGMDESTEEFEHRLQDTITAGFSVPCIALASRLGMFDKMAAFSEAKTSQEISEAMHCKERYVRELLGALVCLRIFDYKPATKTYIFPSSRHSMLTTKGGSLNIAPMVEFLPMMMQVYQPLLNCFQVDGPLGVSYDEYPGCNETQTKFSEHKFTKDFVSNLMKQDSGLWNKLEQGISVCDIGCGSGQQVCMLASIFPKSSFHGVDIRQDAIEYASRYAEKQNVTNVSFSIYDICQQSCPSTTAKSSTPSSSSTWDNKWDLVMVFDVIHDLPFASRALSNVQRALKPGGQFFMMDIHSYSDDVSKNLSDPSARMTYSTSTFLCLAQSLSVEGSEGLGACMGIEKAAQMLTKAGFSKVRQLDSSVVGFMFFLCDK